MKNILKEKIKTLEKVAWNKLSKTEKELLIDDYLNELTIEELDEMKKNIKRKIQDEYYTFEEDD